MPLAMLTTRPRLRSSIHGTTARQSRNRRGRGWRRRPTTGRGRPPRAAPRRRRSSPALLTSRSTRPSSSVTRATAASTDARSVTSAATARVRRAGGRGDLVHRRPQPVLAAGEPGHRHPAGGQPLDEVPADPRRRAGDQGDLPARSATEARSAGRAVGGGRRDGRVAHRRRLLAGERPVGRPQRQRVRQRPRAGRHRGAGVDVEQPQVLEQLAPRPRAGRRRPRRRAPRRRPPGPGRAAPAGTTRSAGRPAPVPAGSASTSSSIADVRAGSSSAAHTRGCSSPAYPTTRSPTSSSAQRPGCHGARSPARTVSSTPEAAATRRAACTASAHDAGRPWPPPAARLAADRPAPPPRATAAPARRRAARRSSRRPDAGRRRAAAPGVRVAAGEHRAVLEQGDVALAAGEVAGQRGQQAGQQRRPQRRLLLRQRVAHDDDLPPLVVVGQPERVEGRRPDERVGRRLDVAGLGERAADAAAAALHVGEPAAGRRGGQHRGDVVVAGEPDDLLDQVGGVGEVGTPRRRGDLRARLPSASTVAADGLEQLDDLGGRVGDPGHPGGLGDVERDRPAAAPRVSTSTMPPTTRAPPYSASSSAARASATTVISGSTPRSNRLAASLGSRCRRAVRATPVGSQCAASSSTRVVPSPISVDAPPITAARPIGPVSSVISRSSVGELPRRAVEGGELLPLARQPDGDRPGDGVAVEGVHRLAELEHHVVGDVDGEGDAADARPAPGGGASTTGWARSGRGPPSRSSRTGRSARGRRRSPSTPARRTRRAG